MRAQPNRKLTRFFVVNPITDRRLEGRFQSSEEVLVRNAHTGKAVPGRAIDIGRHGLKIETHDRLDTAINLQIIFPKLPDQIQCYGQVVWTRKLETTDEYESGIAVDSWYGILKGENSWKSARASGAQEDRRKKNR